MMHVIEGAREDVGRCLSIAGCLPQYFSPKGLETMRRDLAANPFYVARDVSGQVLGFASVKGSTEQAAELMWMAVAAGHRRQGVGTAIPETVCDELRAKGLRLLLVKTLSERVHYEPYEATRRFY